MQTSSTDRQAKLPLHIGFLTPEYVTERSADGGLANYLKKVAHALAARGHRATIILLSDRACAWNDGPVAVEEVVWPTLVPFLSRLPLGRDVAPAWRCWRAAVRVAATVRALHRKTPFSILQASSYCVPGLALGKGGDIPLVCRASSYTPLLRSAYGRRRSLGDALLDWLEAKQIGEADGAFAPSRLIARTFGRFEGVPVRVIRTPVDADPSVPDPSFQKGNLDGKRYLLFFGTLSFIKGIGIIAEALPGVLARHPELHVAFIGRDDGIPGGKRAFAHVLEACGGSESRLFYHPALPKASLLPVIAAAEGVLMPSLADNYPNACLEAMAQGSIVIGSRDSSLDEMIRDGEDGFLCENGSATSLAEAIERLLGLKPQAKERMRSAARAAMEAAGAEDRIGELVGFYREVIAARAARRREGP